MHAGIPIDAEWITRVLLLSLRITAVFLFTPMLAPASVPITARVLFVVALAAALSLALPRAVLAPGLSAEAFGDAASVFRAGFTELALGATLALGVLLGFAAFALAGQLLAVQIGFGLAQVIDPTSNATVPVLTSAFNLLAVLVFFLIDGHHALLRGLAGSLERFPLGQPWPLEAAFVPIAGQVVALFSLGFALAAPVAFALLLVEMALGVVARNLPQVNMLTMGIPLKVVVGLLALGLWFGGMRGPMTRVYSGIFESWDAVFRSASAPDEGAR